jgi:hypothetical protein
MGLIKVGFLDMDMLDMRGAGSSLSSTDAEMAEELLVLLSGELELELVIEASS